jgi:hypothetical protein
MHGAVVSTYSAIFFSHTNLLRKSACNIVFITNVLKITETAGLSLVGNDIFLEHDVVASTTAF